MIRVLLAGLVLGGAGPSVSTVEAVARGGVLKPRLGRSVVVVPVAGEVRVKPRGARRFVRLRRAGQVPVGSTVDAARGRVNLISARDARGSTQAGEFSGGAFVVSQQRAAPGLTDLRLVGGRANACGRGASGLPGARARQSRSRVIRRLRGNAHGHFRTRGKHSAATVRGTVWLTEDTCDGTLVTDSKGTVETATGGPGFTLNPGQSAIFYCFPPGSAFHRPDYCIAVLSTPATGLFAFGLATRSALQGYDLCVRAPSGTNRCQHFLLGEPDATGLRISGVVCNQDEGPGGYLARWFVTGQPLGVPLPFTATIGRPAIQQCIHQP
jgi:hypothetical protein